LRREKFSNISALLPERRSWGPTYFATFSPACDVVGVDLDYEVLGSANGMLMVTASGTAVKLS